MDFSGTPCTLHGVHWESTRSPLILVGDCKVHLYPGAEADKKYTVANMDKLVGERYRAGIYTLEELASYYRSFFAVMKFLIEKGHLTEKEQNQVFIRGFQAALLDKIQ